MLTLKGPSELNPHRPPVFCQSYIPVMQSAVSMLYAGGGVGKSYTAIRMAINYVLETGRMAALWLTEDSEGENRFRYQSLVEQVYQDKAETLNAKLRFIPERSIPFTKLKDGNALLTEEFWQIRLDLSDFGMVVIDPLLQFQGGDENSNTHAGVMMGALKEWADEEAKSIVLVHHAAKSKEGGVRARGAGEWQNGCRSVFLASKVYLSGSDNLDPAHKQNLEFDLVKDNGLSYFFRDSYTRDLKKILPVFPDYKAPKETPAGNKLFLSMASHNNAKDPSGFLKVSIHNFYEVHNYVMGGTAYSQYEFKDFYRKGDNNLGNASMICLDFDDGMTIEEAQDIFKDVQCCIVTTKSHRQNKGGAVCDRFRAIIPLEKPLSIPVDEYPDFLNTINDRVGGNVDPSTKDLARFYFSSPDNAFYWYSQAQKRLNWEPIYQQMKQERARKKIEKKLQATTEKKHYNGEPNNTMATDCYFETSKGIMSFEDLRKTLSVGEKVTCQCLYGIDHGDMGPRHHSAFVQKADNGNVFYSCSGGRCQHRGTLWCAGWE